MARLCALRVTHRRPWFFFLTAHHSRSIITAATSDCSSPGKKSFWVHPLLPVWCFSLNLWKKGSWLFSSSFQDTGEKAEERIFPASTRDVFAGRHRRAFTPRHALPVSRQSPSSSAASFTPRR